MIFYEGKAKKHWSGEARGSGQDRASKQLDGGRKEEEVAQEGGTVEACYPRLEATYRRKM